MYRMSWLSIPLSQGVGLPQLNQAPVACSAEQKSQGDRDLLQEGVELSFYCVSVGFTDIGIFRTMDYGCILEMKQNLMDSTIRSKPSKLESFFESRNPSLLATT